MAFKINIRPDLESEMETLLKRAGTRSKTEYINKAIAAYNSEIKRHDELERLTAYFENPRNRAVSRDAAETFARVRKIRD